LPVSKCQIITEVITIKQLTSISGITTSQRSEAEKVTYSGSSRPNHRGGSLPLQSFYVKPRNRRAWQSR